MLKRYQVLLPEWLEENIKHIADEYDLSFSEIVRGEICFATLTALMYLYPEYKAGITTEEILNRFKDQTQSKLEREDLHRILSKIYFETRKAVEYRIAQEKKKTKKK